MHPCIFIVRHRFEEKKNPLLNVNLLQSLNLEQYDDTKIKLLIIFFLIFKKY